MVAIIDYGVGNLFSLSASLSYLGIDSTVTDDPETLRAADRYILPGVGAFADAKEKLDRSGLVDVLLDEVAKGKPLLGICLGMQMLFEKSLEYGEHRGLGLLPGVVSPLQDDLDGDLKVPHMGWNGLDFRGKDCPLLQSVKLGDHVYFVHSYYAKDCGPCVAATARYGNLDVTAAVQGRYGKGSVYGTQFHPEKSGEVGLAILRAFSQIPIGEDGHANLSGH